MENERYFISGQTGSGKTRLMRNILDELRAKHPDLKVLEIHIPKDYKYPWNPYMPPNEMPKPVLFRLPEKPQE